MNSNYLPLAALFVVATIAALSLRHALVAPDPEPVSQKPVTSFVASAEPSPFELEAPSGRAATLRKETDGYYWATAKVGRTPVKFMVDTGASVVALTPRDARRLGYNLSQLERDTEIRTAGGTIQAASVTLDEIVIGKVRVDNVRAVIMSDELEQSLLGMSFLERVARWEVTQRAIIIRQ
ncbi:MAG: TIGR02281 family clan AA aspartic protease [Pseudomonadota bacterium]